ncbi:hypothetical protein [Amycolatopsis sp. lyj-112]|uniref:hypothetical protein n=1 Tax=Amycolatopsis sp. lyj-112 TaxID=2789288 RepID=UPI00397CB50B
MIDSLGDIGAALADSEPGKLAKLYRDLRLDLRYNNEKEAVYATTSLRVNNAGVRGGEVSPFGREIARDTGDHLQTVPEESPYSYLVTRQLPRRRPTPSASPY